MRRSAADWEAYARRVGLGCTAFPGAILQTYAGKRVLDIGCGVGRHLASLRGAELRVGLELSQERLRIGARLHEGVCFAQADSGLLPFKPASFDTVLMLDVIEHLPRPETALREIGRVLRPGGRLILLTPNYPAKRLYDILSFLRGKRRDWGLRDDPTHVSKFNACSLRRLMERHFEIELILARNIMFQRLVSPLDRLRGTRLGLWVGQKTIVVGRKPRP